MTVDSRVTSHQADVRGQKCYVEQKIRVVSQTHIPRWYAAFGLLEALTATFPAFGSDVSQTGHYIGYAFIADGLLGALYIFLRDGSISTADSWERTNDTASCVR